MLRCEWCKVLKRECQFPPDKYTLDGRSIYCRACKKRHGNKLRRMVAESSVHAAGRAQAQISTGAMLASAYRRRNS